MRIGVVLGALLAGAVMVHATAAEKLASWNFVGTGGLAELKEQKALAAILAMPQTEALRAVAVQHLATLAAGRISGSGTNVNPELVRLIEPVLAVLWQNESRFEMIRRGSNDADWTLALRVDGEPAKQLSEGLSQLAQRAGMQKSDPAAGAGWTMRKDNYAMSFSTTSGWAVIEGGAAERDAFKQFRDGLKQRGDNKVLTAELNSPLLGRILNARALQQAPKLTVTVVPRGEGLRTEMGMEYPEPLGIQPEKWKVPAELIRDPLIGFTAVQGLEKKMATAPRIKAAAPKETPNQLFLWSQGIGNFSVSFATEVGNAEEVIRNVAKHILPGIKVPVGRVQVATNRAAISWIGLPIIVPFLEAASAPNSTFVTGGLFPVADFGTNKAPAELFQQLDKKNLVYYEWELTGERLQQWMPLWQLYHLVSGTKTPHNSSASAKWLDAVKLTLGNSVTEATLENPRTIKWVRQSHIGLNALEATLLAHWLDPHDLTLIPQRSRPGAPRFPSPGLP